MVALDDLGCIIPREPSYLFTVCQTIYSQSVTLHSTLYFQIFQIFGLNVGVYQFYIFYVVIV